MQRRHFLGQRHLGRVRAARKPGKFRRITMDMRVTVARARWHFEIHRRRWLGRFGKTETGLEQSAGRRNAEYELTSCNHELSSMGRSIFYLCGHTLRPADSQSKHRTANLFDNDAALGDDLFRAREVGLELGGKRARRRAGYDDDAALFEFFFDWRHGNGGDYRLMQLVDNVKRSAAGNEERLPCIA